MAQLADQPLTPYPTLLRHPHDHIPHPLPPYTYPVVARWTCGGATCGGVIDGPLRESATSGQRRRDIGHVTGGGTMKAKFDFLGYLWEGAVGRTFCTGSHVRGIEVTQKSTSMRSMCDIKYGDPIDHT